MEEQVKGQSHLMMFEVKKHRGCKRNLCVENLGKKVAVVRDCGRHILREDFTACPSCDFPAIFSEFIRLLETEENCPMCNEKVLQENLQKLSDPHKYIFPDEQST